MAALKGRGALRKAFVAALSITVLVPPVHSQDTQLAGAARQTIMQQQTGDRLVSVRAEGASQTVALQVQSASSDPAIDGQLDRRWLVEPPAGAPSTTARVEDEEEREDSGAYAELGDTTFAPVVEEDLAAGGKRNVVLDSAASSVLLGSVQWSGSNGPLELTLSLNGASLAQGTATRGNANRGRVSVTALAPASGQATLSVRNRTEDTVHMQLVLGELPQ